MIAHVGKITGKEDTCSLLVGVQTGVVMTESRAEAPQPRHSLPQDAGILFLGTHPKDSNLLQRHQLIQFIMETGKG